MMLLFDPVNIRSYVLLESPGFYIDRSDCSITRTAAHFRSCFDAAGLEVVIERPQTDFPRETFPVCMWALRPRAV